MTEVGPAPVAWEALPARSRPGRPRAGLWIVVALVVVGLPVGVVILRDRLSRPPWSASATELIAGDTWDGNLVFDGQRIVLLSREKIQGFWGVMTVRASEDGGITWSDPVPISASVPNAARHTLVLGSDGSLWAAWAVQGSQVATQRLVVRRSLDGGSTWTEPTRLSPPNVGLVGIPALVVSDRLRLVAFTDGATGDVIVQRLDEAGSPTGDPLIVGRTTRELYSNAQFYDGALAVGAVDDHVVLVYDDGGAARAIVSADGGQTWTDAWQGAMTTTPSRLVTSGDQLIVLEAMKAGTGGEVRAVASDDGGATWTQIGRWTGRPVFGLSLAAGPEETLAAWATCRNPQCSVIDLRVADVGAGLSGPTRIDLGARARPVGLAITDGSLVVASVREDPSGQAAARTLFVAAGPRP